VSNGPALRAGTRDPVPLVQIWNGSTTKHLDALTSTRSIPILPRLSTKARLGTVSRKNGRSGWIRGLPARARHRSMARAPAVPLRRPPLGSVVKKRKKKIRKHKQKKLRRKMRHQRRKR
jgi:hypothetical protein